jgi:glucuronate isomerase
MLRPSFTKTVFFSSESTTRAIACRL